MTDRLRETSSTMMRRLDGGVQLSLLPFDQDWYSSAIREPWENYIRGSSNIDALFQSPAWFDHLAATEPDKRLALAAATTQEGRVLGLAPLVRGQIPLRYEIKGKRFWNSFLDSVIIHGGEALFPPRREFYD